MLITDIMTAFRQGKELANAETWKNRTVLLNSLMAFFAAALGIAKGLGYAIDIDHDTLQNLAAGVVAAVGVVNAVMHVITSQRVGLPPVGGAGDGSSGSQG